MFKIEERRIDKEIQLHRFQCSSNDGIYKQLCIDVYKIAMPSFKKDCEYMVFFDSAPTRSKNLKKNDYLQWSYEIKGYKTPQNVAESALGDYQYYQETGDKSIFKL